MASINTNASAMAALRSLNSINDKLNTTQARISSGLKVGSAADNAAYWSIATTMRSDKEALGTVKDALGLGAATIDVASTGMTSAIDVTKEIKNKLVAARQPGVDRAKIQTEVQALQDQLTSIGDSSVFSGENWLSVDSGAASYNATKTVVASFNRTSSGVSVGTLSVSLDDVKLFDADDQSGILDTEATTTNGAVDYSVTSLDISALTDSADDSADLEEMIAHVDSAIQSMTTAGATLGSASSRIKMQTDFVKNLSDAIDRGIGTLVDADMTEESTRLQALQVQQQLGVQALSIANQGNQSILSLFR